MFLKSVLKNFVKLTGKHLNQSLFFNKVAGLQQQLCLKRNCGTGAYLLILRKLLKHYFIEQVLGTTFQLRRGNMWARASINQASRFQSKILLVDFYRNKIQYL